MRRAMNRALLLLPVLALYACDRGDAPAKDDATKTASKSKKDEPKADAKSDAPAADATVDACSLLTTEQVAKAAAIEGEITTATDAVRLMFEFESQCAWQAGGDNRVTLIVTLDPEGKDFGRLKANADAMAKAGADPKTAIIWNAEDVAGSPAVARADGSLTWSTKGRLFTVNVFAPGQAMGLKDDGPRRTLAVAATAKL